MKTNNKANITHIILKDGLSTLASWTHQFDKEPTIGEIISISGQWTDPLPGYGDRATVRKIELNTKTNELNIEVEPLVNQKESSRPVVALNADLIPERVRPAVEAYLRDHLDLPLLDWEQSRELGPILRLHENGSKAKLGLPELQAGIRHLLHEANELTLV